MKSILITLTILTSFIFSPNLVTAQNAGQQDITSNLKVFKIKTESQGQVSRQTVQTVEPGDTLEYQLTYTNHLDNAISQLKPVLPIPNGVEYLGNSANPSIVGASLSLQEGPMQNLPIQEQTTTSSGLQVNQNASHDKFRRIQWLINSLQPNSSLTLTARVKVVKSDALTLNQ